MSAPAPDAEVKPDSPDDLTARSWKYVLRKTAREFGKDQCTDNAAALTYYAVLALFPGLIALLSLVGLVGQGDQAARTVLEVLRDTGVGSVADTLEPTLLERLLVRPPRRDLDDPVEYDRSEGFAVPWTEDDVPTLALGVTACFLWYALTVGI